MANWPTMNFPWITPTIFPDDAEERDKELIKEQIEKIMDSLYPSFEPEVIPTFSGKEYYLPALKALYYDGHDFYSPSQAEKWTDMELEGYCKNDTYALSWEKPKPHKAPSENCECGIYGSVNLEELVDWMDYDYEFHHNLVKEYEYEEVVIYVARYGTDVHITPPPKKRKGRMVLCIIEPSIGADVILCRKGWKASQAFISEVVGETIDIHDASNLLSMAWKREINVGKVFENENR